MRLDKTPVYYSQKMVANIDMHSSPSASKPALVAEALRSSSIPTTFVEPYPASQDDMALAHARKYVTEVLSAKRPNGFGNYSQEVIRSLPFTNGAVCQAVEAALTGAQVTAALASGFHHAGYEYGGGFCTFNGLMIAAQVLIKHYDVERVAIVDADYHYGDGTQNIIDHLGLKDKVLHYSFGKDFHSPKDATAYLDRMHQLRDDLKNFKPAVIIYQAGADAHCDDPLGGVLTTKQLYERDKLMFEIGRDLNIGIAFVLAGGYQRDPDGGISKVVEVHLNTFRAAVDAFNEGVGQEEGMGPTLANYITACFCGWG